jgi:hypothetical protein
MQPRKRRQIVNSQFFDIKNLLDKNTEIIIIELKFEKSIF